VGVDCTPAMVAKAVGNAAVTGLPQVEFHGRICENCLCRIAVPMLPFPMERSILPKTSR
jgi:hypothetical protein